jgi:hypothetical protein
MSQKDAQTINENNLKNTENGIAKEMNENEVLDLTAEQKLCAGLSYFGLFAFIGLIFQHDNPYIAYHVRQGLVLAFIFWVLEHFFFFFSLSHIILFIQMGCAFYFGFLALKGKKFVLPFVSDTAQKMKDILLFRSE